MKDFHCPDHGFRVSILSTSKAVVVCGAPMKYGQRCKKRCVAEQPKAAA